jgi:hypothetical protein
MSHQPLGETGIGSRLTLGNAFFVVAGEHRSPEKEIQQSSDTAIIYGEEGDKGELGVASM